jgi:DNA-binding CsgD family transcriptional regulator
MRRIEDSQLLLSGLPLNEISGRLGLSLKSVRTYTEQLFERASIQSRSQLAPAALRDGVSPCAHCGEGNVGSTSMFAPDSVLDGAKAN